MNGAKLTVTDLFNPKLEPEEVFILFYRYGLGGHSLTLESVATKLNLEWKVSYWDRVLVRQTELRAMRKVGV